MTRPPFLLWGTLLGLLLTASGCGGGDTGAGQADAADVGLPDTPSGDSSVREVLPEAPSGDGAPDSAADSGMPMPDGGPEASACLPGGEICSSSAQCCDKSCDPMTLTCCVGLGGACTSNDDCCNYPCDLHAGLCSSTCTPTGVSCTADAQCCSGSCMTLCR